MCIITFCSAVTKASQSALRASVSRTIISLPCGAVLGSTFSARATIFFTLGSPSILVASMSCNNQILVFAIIVLNILILKFVNAYHDG